MTVRHLYLLIGATWSTYRYRSMSYFAERKRLFFLVAFLLAPLASIPELLVSPVMIIADAGAPLRFRASAFALVLSLWIIWFAATRPFAPAAYDFAVLRVVMSSEASAIGFALRLAATGWPLMPLSLLIALTGPDSAIHRALGALVLSAIAAMAANSTGRYMHRWYGRWGYAARSRPDVLFRFALMDIVPCRRPALLVRYLFGLGCVVFAVRFAPESEAGAIVELGIASGIVVWIMREAVAALRKDTLKLAPVLSTSRFLHRLCVARLIAMAGIFSSSLTLLAIFMPGSFGSLSVALTFIGLGTTALAGLRMMRLTGSWDWLGVSSVITVVTVRFACQS